jgi:hypothetical protein
VLNADETLAALGLSRVNTGTLGRPSRKIVAFRKLTHAYHDALLLGCRVGPQREVILDIRLDSVWNPNGPLETRLRFGAINNFEKVREFFQHLLDTAKHNVLDEIVGIVATGKGEWTVDLARAGAVVIATPKIPQEA